MRIEILYPEVCNLFGDPFNMVFLERSLPEAEFLRTPLNTEPRFLSEPVDLVYMGPMTERTQALALERLTPHREAVKSAVERGVHFLCTGNAMELFGDRIENEDGSKLDCLGVFRMTAKRDMMHRHNSVFLGTFAGTEIMGFKTQFTMGYTDDPKNEQYGLFRKVKGVGLNKKALFEGIHYKNFYGTYLVGPILILNPEFAKYLLRELGAGDVPPAFTEAVEEAAELRRKDFAALVH